MMMRPPSCMCLSAAWVAMKTPRTLRSMTRSISSSVVSSNGFGMAVPALFTRMSSRPKVATRLFDRGCDGLGIGGVRLDRDRLSAGCLDLFDHRRGGVGALGVGDRDAGAVGGQALGDGGADSAGRAGDERDFVVQIGHGMLHSRGSDE